MYGRREHTESAMCAGKGVDVHLRSSVAMPHVPRQLLKTRHLANLTAALPKLFQAFSIGGDMLDSLNC